MTPTELMPYTRAEGLDAAEVSVLAKLIQQLEGTRSRNRLRTLYRDGEKTLRTAEERGMAMPQQLGRLQSVIGWPAKAVDVMDQRIELEGFVMQDATELPRDLRELLDANQYSIESSQARSESMVHGTAFTTISAGVPGVGEPDVVIRARSATEATGIWSPRRRGIVAGLTINDGASPEYPEINLWLPYGIVTIFVDEYRRYRVQRAQHDLGHSLMVMSPYKPSLTKRYGISRISRPLMDLTDAAARTIMRMEGTAEFFSFPQRWAIGVDEEDFDLDTFKTYLNRILALGQPEDGPAPTVGTFSAASPEPHIAQLRSIAMMVSGETSIPVNYLGIIQDNPSSADAIRAAESDLVKAAERAMRVYAASDEEIVRVAQLVRDGEPDPALIGVKARYRDPSTPTKSAVSQSTLGLVGAGVLNARSRLTWEQLGYDETLIKRLEAEERMLQGLAALEKITTPATDDQVDELTAEQTT